MGRSDVLEVYFGIVVTVRAYVRKKRPRDQKSIMTDAEIMRALQQMDKSGKLNDLEKDLESAISGN